MTSPAESLECCFSCHEAKYEYLWLYEFAWAVRVHTMAAHAKSYKACQALRFRTGVSVFDVIACPALVGIRRLPIVDLNDSGEGFDRSDAHISSIS